MTWVAWGSSLFKDPEPMWSTKEAARSGNNMAGFSDPDIDALIERQKSLFDPVARHAICREIDRLVFAQHPYALLWNIDYTRLLYWNKFGTPPTILAKYGDERSAYWYWWYDEDSAAALRDAQPSGKSLPAVKPTVAFDDVFKP
jgi:microcin C transport system substrate-binding protein